MNAKYLSLVCTLFLLAMGITGCKEKSASPESATSPKMEVAATATTSPKAEDMKKVIRAQVFIKTDRINDFINFTKDLIEKSRAEEGNISYTLYQSPTDKTKFIFFEEWKNQAAVDFHFKTDHFKAFSDAIGGYSSAPAVVTVYDVASEK